MQPSPPVLSRRQCRHCGTPFAPRHEAEHFCCSGCEAVSALIQTQGLGHFYDLRQGISTPVGERGGQPHDFNWLQTLSAQAEADARANTTPAARASGTTATRPDDIANARTGNTATAILALPIDGIHCAGCRWLIDQLFTQQPCADSCALDAQGQYIRFSWRLPEDDGQPHFDVPAFANLLLAFGYTLENPAQPRSGGQQNNSPANTPASARKRLAPRLLLCGVFALNAVIFSLPVRLGASVEDFPLVRLFGLLVFLCATLATGLAASYFWQTPTPLTNGRPAPNRSAAAAATTTQTGIRLTPRRMVALALVLLCILSFAGASLALPAIFAADTVAAASFVTLLIAFAAKR